MLGPFQHLKVIHTRNQRQAAAIVPPVSYTHLPRYVLIEFSQLESEQQASDEDVLAISRRLMAKNKEAYEVLAK